ncbi:phosphatidylglycerol:prolipoprotein diacylglycerol transferase [Albimonas donghaensis]|uniref:Phosphatidylglycerol--prolipoprotein diacylglyceryl transferase n=1 Tax=Albimonas donghaensis TaxID=356660 RepID=A0A1H3E878_9RHOB|nr:prolipoprotein diacylglyceryl transferase [Albimonas donghaensis]SDX74827.1 phosphatidylglycerol:prolipoprotein diacylglycerol transferase [Albimonas donghaensis]
MFAIPFPNIDPAIFSLELGSFTFSLRWYALAYIAGLILGWRYVARLAARPALWRGAPPMSPAEVEELLTWMVVGVIAGGRLGFVIFYQPAYYLANPAEIPAIWNGGMSFHGGFLGVIAGVWLWARAKGRPVMEVGDAVACAAPIGLLLGRIANFINAELWGRTTDAPWGVIFPNGGPEPRHPSQIYEAGLEGAVLFLVMWWLATRAGWLKRPGALIGVFLVGYGLARSVVELFRQPDRFLQSEGNPLGLAWQWGPEAGLTMGQILSIPMILAGVAVIVAARRGAWARGAPREAEAE